MKVAKGMEQGVRGGNELGGWPRCGVGHCIRNRWVLVSLEETQQAVCHRRNVLDRRSASVWYALKRDTEDFHVSGFEGGDCRERGRGLP